MQGLAKREFVVFGLLNERSIAYAVGERLAELGARVTYVIQNDILRRRYLEPGMSDGRIRSDIQVATCDVMHEEEVEGVFEGKQDLGGLVYSVAYANPKTCLGATMHSAPVEDINQSYDVSCAALATVMKHASGALAASAGVVAMTFDSHAAYPAYNWMGVHKAALEALVRALAREHGPRGVRVNAVSAGPVATTAASKIPDFQEIERLWQDSCPVGWDPDEDRHAVANGAAFLLSDMAAKVTGQVLFVDGGASSSRGTVK